MSGLQSFLGNKFAISTKHRNMCWTCGAHSGQQMERELISQSETAQDLAQL